MVGYYSILKYFVRIKSRRLKLVGLWLMHVTGRRYIGMFLDPVMSCNLRCQMCAFSDDKERPKPTTPMTEADYDAIARAVFHRVMKLQIGCGAEPTLYKDLPNLIRKAKQYGIGHVSITTNGNLLTQEKIFALAEAGLDEITLSTHGLRRETYEWLMTNAHYDQFVATLHAIAAAKKQYPGLKLRINYTINADNFDELSMVDSVFEQIPVDILQVRPIQDLGASAYRNFDLSSIEQHYDDVMPRVAEFCDKHDTTFLYPTRDNLATIATAEGQGELSIQDFAYCYCYPEHCLDDDFDFRHETYEQYFSRKHKMRALLHAIVGSRHYGHGKTIALNYKVK